MTRRLIEKRKEMAKIKNGTEELENQLHQQLAENDNNRISTFLSFIVGIIALFGFYGYVYVNTYKRKWRFDANEFLLMAIITIGILCFFSILALNLGYSFRRDQFIVYKIRKKRYKNEENYKEIFGGIYTPFRKEYYNFIPGFYNFFYWLFSVSGIFIDVTIYIKNKEIGIFFTNCNWKDMFYIFLSFHIILLLIFRFYYFWKYKEEAKKIPE